MDHSAHMNHSMGATTTMAMGGHDHHNMDTTMDPHMHDHGDGCPSGMMVMATLLLYYNTVKSFNFMGTKFYILTAMDMFVDTWIHGFQIMHNITKVNKYFGGILNSLIALPMEIMKLNDQWIKIQHKMKFKMSIILISAQSLFHLREITARNIN